MKRANVLSCTLLAASMFLSTWARAEPSASQKAAAQALFEKGRDLVEQGHFAEACPKLAESQRLDPGLGTSLWLADCLESNGQTASAWAAFTEAAAIASRAHDRRETVARDRAQKLVPKLSRITLTVKDPSSSGIVVRRDGTEIGHAEWGVAIPLDPGKHTYEASAPGRKPWSTTVEVPARAVALEVTVPVLEAAPVAQTAAPLPESRPSNAPAPVEQAPREAPPAAASGNGRRTLGFVIAGAGVVGLGVGAYFSLHAKSLYDGAASNGHCQPNNQCDPTGKQDRRDAFTQATVATVALGVGAAAVLGGAILYFTAPRGVPVTAGVSPGLRGGSAWLSATF